MRFTILLGLLAVVIVALGVSAPTELRPTIVRADGSQCLNTLIPVVIGFDALGNPIFGSAFCPRAPSVAAVNVVCSSQSALVMATAIDMFGDLAADGTAVGFSVSPGNITSSALTVGGVASAVFTPAPGMTGLATLTTTVNGGPSQYFTINCGPGGGPASFLTMTIPQGSDTCGSQVYVLVTPTDVFGAPRPSAVFFAASDGSITPAATPVAGIAYGVFTATPLIAETVQITVSAPGANTLQASLPVTCFTS